MVLENRFLWYWLSRLIDCGLVTIEKFVEYCGGVEAAMHVSRQQLDEMPFLNDRVRAEILRHLDISVIYDEYNQLEKRGIRFSGRDDADFPRQLLDIAGCPFGLYYIGRLPKEDALSIAVVGARTATVYGQEMARSIARDLSLAGVQVISGLAVGIDGFAHRGALLGGTDTFAVLGCGVNICYPKENMDLFESIKECGGLISEFPLDSTPKSWHFPVRNRIISGLSRGILVVEARERSGSLITAGLGLEQGRDVFAVPGRPTDALSAGCNQLIFDGARPVCDAGDILREYGICKKLPQKNNIVLDNLENMVYSSLCLDAQSIERLSDKVHLAYAQTAKLLFVLEKKGLARQIGKNQYIRRL